MSSSSGSRRARATGKGAGASFVSFPHFVLDSPQWALLPAAAVKLLMELARQYKGANNGDLQAVHSLLKERGWRSKETLQSATEELERAGWIVRTRQGGRHIGCNLFAITWWPVDECGGRHQHPIERKPSHLWKNAIGPPKIGER